MLPTELDIKLSDPAGAGAVPPATYDVLVIGGGPAGATVALYAARAGLSVVVIDKGLTNGALGVTHKIAHYPGVPGEIEGAALLQRFRTQAEAFGATFVQDKVQGVDLEGELKTVWANGGHFTGRTLVVATGAMGRGQRVPGEDRLLGRGVSYCATCDAAFFRGQTVAVAGSSDEALEEALFLTRFVQRLHLLVPTPALKASHRLVEAVQADPLIQVWQATTVRAVLGAERVEGLRLATRGTGEQTLRVTGAFFYLQGGRPITDFLQAPRATGASGCLQVDREFRTGLPGVYAVGDVLCDHVKQAVVAAAEGAVAAMAIEKDLRGRRQLAVDWSK